MEAAERLGVDVTEVYRMIDQHRLTASWNGRRLMVPVVEVEALARSSTDGLRAIRRAVGLEGGFDCCPS